jgi:UDP-N-acetylmuramoylalanine--D-glutamate ligase
MKKNISEPVGVLGVGVEGRATIAYLQAMGIREIVALDFNEVDGLPPDVSRVFGQEHNRDLSRFATIFRSPGIRPDHPSLVAAKEAGTRVTSAVDHFLLQCEAPVVGITGTVGKGTAASLTAHLLGDAGFTTHLGGNIGRSPLEFLDEVEANHRVVLEISSFQAMDVSSSPSIGVVLKTTSEHLDWHTSTDEYIEAKATSFVFKAQKT